MRHQGVIAYRSCLEPHLHRLDNSDNERMLQARNRRTVLADDFDDNFIFDDTHRRPTGMERSRLMELPAELRLTIFEYALQEQHALGVGGSYTTSAFAPKIFGGDAEKQAHQPSIAWVSKQFRRETLPLFYRQNKFLLALHYRRARTEVTKWINCASLNPAICANLWNITIKHRFGILDFRGTIDFDMKELRILGPNLWYNAIPPLTIKEVEKIMDGARQAERSDQLIVNTLRQLVELLGV